MSKHHTTLVTALATAQVSTAIQRVCDHHDAFTPAQVQNIANYLARRGLSLTQLGAVTAALTKSTPGFDPAAFTHTLFSTQRHFG